MKSESRTEVTRRLLGGNGKEREGYSVLAGDGEIVLGINHGDAYTTLCV